MLSQVAANMSGTRYTGTDLTGALKDPIKDPKRP